MLTPKRSNRIKERESIVQVLTSLGAEYFQEPNVGGSEMASREKRPLAPSKAKQKANNDSNSPIDTTKSKKGKALSNVKQQQIARNILDAVATGSQLPAKLDAGLPRKKALETALKRKHKLVAKTSFIKVKQKVPIKSIKRIGDAKKNLQNKKKKPKASLIAETKSSETVENHEAAETESVKSLESGKAAKNSVKVAKKSVKASTKASDPESTGGQEKSPKTGKKTVEASPKTSKAKASLKNKNEGKEKESKNTDSEAKTGKAKRSLSKEPDSGSAKRSLSKEPDSGSSTNSIDNTIEEVIASMLTDSDTPDEGGSISEAELSSSEQTANRTKKKQTTSTVKRNLRNGKLRQSSDSTPSEIESVVNSMETKPVFPETGSDTKSITLMEVDSVLKEEASNHVSNTSESPVEVENNNNGGERLSDIYGPTLRSKMKARSAETEIRTNETKMEVKVDAKAETKVEEAKTQVLKTLDGVSEEVKKPGNFDFMRKQRPLPKFAEKPKSRRSSLNIDMRKTVGSFYGSDKADSTPQKSQIDQMIENIKLTIAKSIESKIYGPEKGLGIGKSFDIPKIEEIIAPLKTDSQKMVFKESDEKTETSKTKDVAESENSENSVPKVADTAKEIEKLVMGDVKLEKTHSQEDQDQSASPDETKEEKVSQSTSQTPSLDKEKEDVKQVTGTRKSPRNLNKSHQESNVDSNRTVQKPLNVDVDEMRAKHKNDLVENKISSIPLNIEDVKDEVKDPNPSETQEMEIAQEDANEFTRKLVSPVVQVDEAMEITDSSTTELSSLKQEETLESLSLEVEKLVADDNVIKASSNETVQSEEPMEIEEQSDKVEVLNSESISDIAAASTNDESQNAGIESTSEAMEVTPSVELIAAEQAPVETTSSEIASNEGANKTNVLTNNGCESNDESSEQNVPDGTNEIKDIENNSLSTAVDETRQKSITSDVNSSDFIINSRDEAKSIEEVDDVKLEVSYTEETNPEKTEAIISVQENLEDKSNTSISSEGIKDESLVLDDFEIKEEETNVVLNSSEETELLEVTKSSEQTSRSLNDTIQTEDVKVEDTTEIEIRKSTETPKPTENLTDATQSTKAPTDAKVVDAAKTLDVCDQRKTEESTESSGVEENRRVLRARDRSKKVDTKLTTQTVEKSETKQKKDDISDLSLNDTSKTTATVKDRTIQQNTENSDSIPAVKVEVDTPTEPQMRTRRSREAKKPPTSASKPKRARKPEVKKTEQQKEETLLDNEVAKINENTQSNKSAESFRGFSADGGQKAEKSNKCSVTNRSKSENDIQTVDHSFSHSEQAETPKDSAQETESRESGSKSKTLEGTQKDSDETSSSGDSSSSAGSSLCIIETPEEREKKERILRILGLESMEKATERINKAKEQAASAAASSSGASTSGTLKTVIRVQKDKDKKRSRSPLKIVLKHGRMEGEESLDFYTIQKELGTSALGESSSGANRKLPTNHRHSCDEEGEDAPAKDRPSLIIPEKSSSFSIHPGRLCADVCCYCFGKFGSLDTPMHLAQMKSDDRRKKILAVEVHLTKDSCLCDACYRHVDRKANTSPTNVQTKPQRQHRQLLVVKCSTRNCRETARHHVKRRWLVKIKLGLKSELDINWESSQHTSMPFCGPHYAQIARLLTCALCKRRLVRNHTHQLIEAEIEDLNERLQHHGIPVQLCHNTFVCKLCRYFTQLHMKHKDLDTMGANHKTFVKNYKKRILCSHNIAIMDNADDLEESSFTGSKDKNRKKPNKSNPSPKMRGSKSPEMGNNSTTSEKSTPEPQSKNEGTNSEPDLETVQKPASPREEQSVTLSDVRVLGGIECAIEKLKKRKALDTLYTTTRPDESGNDVVEILAMDKEVTLTRLPKRPRINNDITPVVQRLGANPSISVRSLFPGEEEMNLHATVDFGNVREVTPQGWEKCATVIQYDRDTKVLWQELQRPYGNQSSFLRHLILLEKYYRAGDLVLAPNASRNAINYSTSVQNRLISYEGPEKMDEPIMEPIAAEFNPRRLSGGYVLERDRISLPSNSTGTVTAKASPPPPRVLKLTPGVSIIKKPPPSLQRLNLPSTSGVAHASSNGSAKRKEPVPMPRNASSSSGGKVFQLTEPDLKRLQSLKRQKMLTERQSTGSPAGSSTSTSTSKAQSAAAHTQFQKHVRMQQEMLNRQSRGDFEPLICDVRALNANENSPTQNLLHNLNLPKSIQVTTKPSNPIPILPKIPKSLTVIPQTVPRPADK